MNDVAEIKLKLSSSDVDDVYDALIDIGKQEHRCLEKEVWDFLTHEEPDLQRAAIMVLGTYWKLPEFSEKARALLNSSSDDDVRVAALINWVGYYEGTKDANVITVLNDFIRDSSEDIFIRLESVRGLFRVYGETIADDKMRALERVQSYSEFDNLAPWDDIDRIVESQPA